MDWSAPLGYIFQSISELLYPTICINCQQEEPEVDSVFCFDCCYSLPFLNDPSTSRSLLIDKASIFSECWTCMALFTYAREGKVQDMIHRLKYKGQDYIGIALGRAIARRYSDLFSREVTLMPIPLHPKKLKKRGYNQALKIAEGIASITGSPIDTHTLIRRRHLVSQTTKSQQARLEVLQDTYISPKSNQLTNQNILLIDDVITTGATMIACLQALEPLPTNKIGIVSTAIAV